VLSNAGAMEDYVRRLEKLGWIFK